MLFLYVLEAVSKIEKWFEFKDGTESKEIPTYGRDFF